MSNDAHGPFYTVSHDDLKRWEQQVKAMSDEVKRLQQEVKDLRQMGHELRGELRTLIALLGGTHANETRD